MALPASALSLHDRLTIYYLNKMNGQRLIIYYLLIYCSSTTCVLMK